MRTAAVIVVDGVLMNGEHPIEDNKAIFRALQHEYQIILLTLDTDRQRALERCKREGIYNDVIVCKDPEWAHDDAFWKFTALRRIRAGSWKVSLFIDTDTTAIARVAEDGVTCLQVITNTGRPGWMPENRTKDDWETVAGRFR